MYYILWQQEICHIFQRENIRELCSWSLMNLKGLTVKLRNDPNPSNHCVQSIYFPFNKKAYSTKKAGSENNALGNFYQDKL